MTVGLQDARVHEIVDPLRDSVVAVASIVVNLMELDGIFLKVRKCRVEDGKRGVHRDDGKRLPQVRSNLMPRDVGHEQVHLKP